MEEQSTKLSGGEIIVLFFWCGGAVGGLWLFAFMTVFLSSVDQVAVTDLMGFIFVGFIFGCIPAALCAGFLVWRRYRYTGWRSLWLPALAGALSPGLFIIWFSWSIAPFFMLFALPAGMLSAISLAPLLFR